MDSFGINLFELWFVKGGSVPSACEAIAYLVIKDIQQKIKKYVFCKG